MPTLSLSRRPKFAPDDKFIVTAGFALTLVENGGPFCPKVGTTWRASHPGIAHMLRNGGLGKYLVPAGSTEEDLGAARMAAGTITGQEAADPFVRLAEELPIADQRRCTEVISSWFGGSLLVINVGEIRSRHDPVVKANPHAFEAVTE